ncbi:hypothetical protein D3C78_1381420 [compost metagenome]
MMHRFLQAQRQATVSLDRQVIAGRGDIQGSRHDVLLVPGFFHRHRQTMSEDTGQLAFALVRQMQYHQDRHAKTFAQVSEDPEQRFDATGRCTDDNGLDGRVGSVLRLVHNLR